ncbi:hypothetical protein B1207_15580 [Legionella quinlivanii]|uniref:Uncharacterized protein n=1 Tax=Legionella quinlivanii TaxID=45073 RepID=A0A364LF84_9GAMM|nr:hypothetical protein [Legionella quinlivanii]RAP34541.1 hypothetical protein B1207_15580 [Legionella quinlivanii]
MPIKVVRVSKKWLQENAIEMSYETHTPLVTAPNALAYGLVSGSEMFTSPKQLPFAIGRHNASAGQFFIPMEKERLYYPLSPDMTIDDEKEEQVTLYLYTESSNKNGDKSEVEANSSSTAGDETDTEKSIDEEMKIVEVAARKGRASKEHYVSNSLLFHSEQDAIQFGIKYSKTPLLNSICCCLPFFKAAKLSPIQQFRKSEHFRQARSYLVISQEQLPGFKKELDAIEDKPSLDILSVFGQYINHEINAKRIENDASWMVIRFNKAMTFSQMRELFPETVENSLQILNRESSPEKLSVIWYIKQEHGQLFKEESEDAEFADFTTEDMVINDRKLIKITFAPGTFKDFVERLHPKTHKLVIPLVVEPRSRAIEKEPESPFCEISLSH